MFRWKNDDEINFYIEILDTIESRIIKKTLIKDLKWYHKKTKSSKKWFIFLTFLTISIPAITPIANSLTDNKAIVNGIAAVNTIISSWLAFRNYKLSWARYGQTYENIKREIRYALVKSYKGCKFNTDQNKLERDLFMTVENITSAENGQWINYVMKKDRTGSTVNSENRVNETKGHDDNQRDVNKDSSKGQNNGKTNVSNGNNLNNKKDNLNKSNSVNKTRNKYTKTNYEQKKNSESKKE